MYCKAREKSNNNSSNYGNNNVEERKKNTEKNLLWHAIMKVHLPIHMFTLCTPCHHYFPYHVFVWFFVGGAAAAVALIQISCFYFVNLT